MFVHVESDIVQKVQIIIMEEHGYCDRYNIYLQDGQGGIRIDSISYGEVSITSNIDGEEIFYYPSNIILFQKDDFIHKVNIIDRRKKHDQM